MKFSILLLVALSALLPIRAYSSITIMPLGDSISAGYDGAPMAGYRQDLLSDLTAQGITTQYVGTYDPTPLNVYGQNALGYSPAMTAIGQNQITAFPGMPSSDILANLDGSKPFNYPSTWPFISNQGGYWITGGGGTGRSAVSPNIVLMMVGTNDYYSNLTAAQSESNIAGVLNWFRADRPQTTVILASPPASTAAGIGSDVAAIDTALETNITPTAFPNTEFVDVYKSFLNPDSSVNGSMLSGDGVHPTDAGYAVIASEFDQAIVSAVPEPGCAVAVGLLLLGLGRSRRCP